MSKELIERLRRLGPPLLSADYKTLAEAADLIEQLERELESIRALAMRFAGAVSLDESWTANNETTETILRAAINKHTECVSLIAQGVNGMWGTK